MKSEVLSNLEKYCANPEQPMRCTGCGWSGKCKELEHDEAGAIACLSCDSAKRLEINE